MDREINTQPTQVECRLFEHHVKTMVYSKRKRIPNIGTEVRLKIGLKKAHKKRVNL